MADLKISQLTSATTPLAGTEVLPIVQSGSTKKVSAANLTAGRTVTAKDVDLSVTPSSSADQLAVKVTNAGENGATFDVYNAFGPLGQVAITKKGGGNQADDGKYVLRLATNSVLFDVITVSETGDQTLSTGNLVQGVAAKGVNFTANTPAAGMTSQLLNWYEEGTFTPADASGAGLTLTNQSGYYTRVGRLVTCHVQFQYPVTADGSQARISLPFTAANDTNCGGGVFYVNTPGLAGTEPNVVGNQAYFVLSNVAGGTAYLNVNASGNYFRGTISYIV